MRESHEPADGGSALRVGTGGREMGDAREEDQEERHAFVFGLLTSVTGTCVQAKKFIDWLDEADQ